MLGKLEEMILLAAIRAGADASAADIHEIVCDRAGKEKSFGAIWTTLNRMDDKGFVKSVSRVVPGSRRSKPRKLFTITGQGQEALAHSLDQTRRLLEGSGFEGGIVAG